MHFSCEKLHFFYNKRRLLIICDLDREIVLAKTTSLFGKNGKNKLDP